MHLCLKLVSAFLPCALSWSVTVDTSFGSIIGSRGLTSGCDQFLGIPYAKPPVGQRRFAAPEIWTDPYPSAGLQAQKFRSSCVQPGITASMTNPTTDGSEDCLFLNIWRKSGIAANASLPVMLWIHGGSFEIGSAADPLSNGCRLGRRYEVIVAAMNYRLGVLGFAAFKDKSGTRANFGMQDQRMAMAWVKGEVGAFGGDPAKITLFGESAGGISVFYHLVSPLSKGYFRAAISESGFPHANSLTIPLQNTRDLASKLNCTGGDATLLECLRNLNASQIISKANEEPSMPFSAPTPSWGPAVDGIDMPEYPTKRHLDGKSTVPVMAGTNTDEANLFVFMNFKSGMNATMYGHYVDDLIYHMEKVQRLNDQEKSQLFNMYPPVQGDNRPVAAPVVTDFTFLCGTHLALQHSSNSDVYLYRFDHRPACEFALRKFIPGVYHGSEIQYVFEDTVDALGLPCHGLPSESALSNRMGIMWTNFAKYLQPTHPGAANEDAFPKYTNSTRKSLLLRSSGDTIEEDYREKYCQFVDRVSLSKFRSSGPERSNSETLIV